MQRYSVVQRITVIGNGGGGKSTLARALGERLDIPVHEVDAVQWRPGWERASLVHLRSPAEMRWWLDSVQAPVRRSS